MGYSNASFQRHVDRIDDTPRHLTGVSPIKPKPEPGPAAGSPPSSPIAVNIKPVPTEILGCHAADIQLLASQVLRYLGTKSFNILDDEEVEALLLARKISPSPRPIKPKRISNTGNNKRSLTDDQVRYIRTSLDGGISRAALADDLGVAYGVIRDIDCKQSYRNVT